MPDPKMPPLTYATAYRKLGWSVIPIKNIGSAEERKRPAVKWQEFQESAADQAQIDRWWAENPDYNVAVITGSVSKLVVIDLDGPNAMALLEREGLRLPKTASVQTGKGHHAYYRYAGAEIGNRARILTDGTSAVDVRGEGGYVVAPPSRHSSGRLYQWVVSPKELASLPPDLEEWLTTAAPHSKTILGQISVSDADWFKGAEDGVGEGARNETAAKMAGYWLRMTGGNVEAAMRALLVWNKLNKPPLPVVEIETVIRSVAKLDERRKVADAAKNLPRIRVIEGEEWARELETTEPRKGEKIGMPGFELIEGLVPGDLIVLAGRPRMGKSTYACQLTSRVALERKIPTFIISTEMSRYQWGWWTAAVQAGVEAWSLPKPLMRSQTQVFAESPVAICDMGTIKVDEIRSLAQGRLGLRLLIVDHIGRVGSGRKESRELEVGEVARNLKALARDLQCTVLAICQLNREIEKRETPRPKLSDLRDSGQIEQECDACYFLWSPDPPPKDNRDYPVFLTLEKYRYGPSREIKLTFETQKRRFVEG